MGRAFAIERRSPTIPLLPLLTEADIIASPHFDVGRANHFRRFVGVGRINLPNSSGDPASVPAPS